MKIVLMGKENGWLIKAVLLFWCVCFYEYGLGYAGCCAHFVWNLRFIIRTHELRLIAPRDTCNKHSQIIVLWLIECVHVDKMCNCFKKKRALTHVKGYTQRPFTNCNAVKVQRGTWPLAWNPIWWYLFMLRTSKQLI